MASVVNDLNSLRGRQNLIANQFEEMQRYVVVKYFSTFFFLFSRLIFLAFHSENTALWREVVQLRQKNDQQRRMIGKIMEFLSRLVRQDELPGAPPRLVEI